MQLSSRLAGLSRIAAAFALILAVSACTQTPKPESELGGGGRNAPATPGSARDFAVNVGDIVYFADLGNKRTIGLGARTGRRVFEHERGSYNPVVSDGETIFLTGYTSLYALRPPSKR